MKKVSYIVLTLLSLVLLAGCNKWLDIEPKDQASDDKVFKDYVGFRNALNGIYEMLSKQSLYGREMSWGFASALAQTYNCLLYTSIGLLTLLVMGACQTQKEVAVDVTVKDKTYEGVEFYLSKMDTVLQLNAEGKGVVVLLSLIHI